MEDNSKYAVLAASAQRAMELCVETVSSLSDAQKQIHTLRTLVGGINDLNDALNEDEGGVRIVADPEVLRQSEDKIWDAIEALMMALEPNPEDLPEAFMDEEMRNEFNNHILGVRQKFAEKRAKAMAE